MTLSTSTAIDLTSSTSDFSYKTIPTHNLRENSSESNSSKNASYSNDPPTIKRKDSESSITSLQQPMKALPRIKSGVRLRGQSTRSFGLNPNCQKELISQLKRINLSRHQYERCYQYEERKIITRMALKLTRSNSNIEALILKRNSIQKPSHSKSVSNISQNKRNGLTLVYKFNNSDRIPSLSISESISSEIAEVRSKSDQITPHLKKTVTWHADIRDRPGTERGKFEIRPHTGYVGKQLPNQFQISSHEKITKSSMHNLNKRYTELRLKYPFTKPILILPKLVADNLKLEAKALNQTCTQLAKNMDKLDKKVTLLFIYITVY